MECFPASFLEIPTLEAITIGTWQVSGEMDIPDLSNLNNLLKELTINHHRLKNEENNVFIGKFNTSKSKLYRAF